MTTPESFVLRGRTLLPLVQGGMGIGISAHRLAGAVARVGAVGTIASIDLRHHHGRAIRPVRELIDYLLTGAKPDLGVA